MVSKISPQASFSSVFNSALPALTARTVAISFLACGVLAVLARFLYSYYKPNLPSNDSNRAGSSPSAGTSNALPPNSRTTSSNALPSSPIPSEPVPTKKKFEHTTIQNQTRPQPASCIPGIPTITFQETPADVRRIWPTDLTLLGLTEAQKTAVDSHVRDAFRTPGDISFSKKRLKVYKWQSYCRCFSSNYTVV